MKYQEAVQIGKECGLSEPAEYVNNIILHAGNLFSYEDYSQELKELREEATAQGVLFSTVCGDAVLTKEGMDRACYICSKIHEIGG